MPTRSLPVLAALALVAPATACAPVTGVIEVQSAAPLRLGVGLTISFPASAQPARTIDGTMTFATTPGTFCDKDN